jgi:membrane fusion protein, copper/silver efflux system
MKPSSTVTLVLVAALAATAGWFTARHTGTATAGASEPADSTRKIKFYQSPMHPWIKADKPGKCTICGMTLVPVYEGESGITTDSGLVPLSAASASVIGVQTTEIRRAPLTRTLRVSGVLDDDETLHRILTARVPGRVEKLFVNQLGAEVAAGEPLVTLYSPEVLNASRLYIERLKAGPNAFPASEVADARERLLTLGLTPDDLARIEKTRVPEATLTMRAPMAGTVVARAAYEGQYVQPDTTLFEIGDLSHLWFLFDAYEPDLPFLKVGQTVEVSVPSRPGETVSAPIAFIDPNLNEMTRTARIRVVIPNTDRRLLHRQTASGRVAIDTPDILLVPRNAVLFTQAAPVVYVDKTAGTYEPRILKLGRSGDTSYEVLSGLNVGDKVVAQGALLIDGQAQLAHSASPPETPPAPVSQPSSLNAQLLLTTADAAAALAADDLPAYASLLPALTAAVHQSGKAHDTLMPLAQKLVPGPDLKTARRAFEPFTTAVADLVRAQPADKREGLKVFECPMAPVLGKARWLQRDITLRNPFFGSAMLDCGAELK